MVSWNACGGWDAAVDTGHAPVFGNVVCVSLGNCVVTVCVLASNGVCDIHTWAKT